MADDLKAPFPWFGGKRKVASFVWQALGDVRNYVEPFFGSGAVLLGRPAGFSGPESVNDLDGFVANFWRAVRLDAEQVADYADWPVNECDLHARHSWLVSQRTGLTARLMGDPDFCDTKIAGYWVWGLCAWIGSGWCSGSGPWVTEGGVLVDSRQLPHLGDAGQGINRKRPHLGNAGQGINRKLPHLGDAGRGINRQLPHLGNAGQGINRREYILGQLQLLADRLREVRVCCGDWSRICGPSVTVKHPGVTGVFLDPPYADTADRQADLYAEDSLSVAHDVRAWALANGQDPKIRIVLCGYEGEHDMLDLGWHEVAWKASGGYEGQGKIRSGNRLRERLWFSPHCLIKSQEVDIFS